MKKGIFILTLLILALFSVSCIYAADVNDSLVASEDTNQIELSDSDKVIEDNLQTSEENEALASTDYDEAIAQTDTEVLGADSATYSDLAEEISQPGNIKLNHKNYTYDKGETITISAANKVIDGNGAVIDMNGSTIGAFHVIAPGVTIKNLTIKNANYRGDGGAIYFDSTGTVTNCNFVDNKATGEYSYGGAVRMYSGTVSNCNFTNNKATGEYSEGGAVWMYSGSVSNCNFTDNKAGGEGGAVWMYSGSVENCNFTDNSAVTVGGAIYSFFWSTADTCIFKTSSDTTFNIGIFPPKLNVDNFTTFYGSGEKLTFNLTTDSGMPVNNGNISISVYFKDNNSWVGNYSCLSGEGWTVSLPVGYYYANFTTEYAGFQAINRTVTITAPEHTFWFLNYTINGNDNPVIELSNDFYFDPAYDSAFVDGIVINRPVTIKGNGNVIDAKGQARIFNVQSADTVIENLTLKSANQNKNGGAVYFNMYGTGTVTNCNFTNNTATYGGAVYFSSSGTVTNCNFTTNTANEYGGAVYFNMFGTGNVTNCNFTNNKATGEYREGGAIWMYSGSVSNCNFTNNTASYNGGAVFFWNAGTVTNCNFSNNSASRGGAVYFRNTGNVTNCNFTGNTASGGGAIRISSGTVTNCNFTGNNATSGSAIFFNSYGNAKTISNSIFLNNLANAESLEIIKNDNNITITFKGKDNLLNAIYSPGDVNFANVTYWGANGIANTDSSTPSRSKNEAGQNITVGIVVNDKLVLDNVYVTDENGMIVLDISAGENYYISARHDTDSYYTEAETTISNNTKFNVNVTSKTTTNKTVNITAKSNIYSEFMPGKLLFILPNGTQINATYGGNGIWWAVHTFDAYGEYKVNATYVGLDNVTVNNATITVNKIKTELSGNAITTTYNINKDLIITLKDSNGNPVSGAKLIVDLNGAKTYTTDSNGQVKVSTKGLAPNVYTAKVTFDGNTNYDKSALDVKVTVNKATPKLTAKKKTFKTSVKTKKYTITLKDNTGKAIKKAKVTLKVKGKTYKATTNSKGKAVFKIKNLKKKGTFKATITYKGNKYYNKVSKKANIKVIVTFKTVSKGSKDKATVREIQQALKNNGYYLTYDGHYLKIDGIYHGCTERSVKEFQHDKGLKVTGKVDEKTAKKLGII